MDFKRKLEALDQKGRKRSLALPRGLDLSSNDYLCFAQHPVLLQAAQDYLCSDHAMIGAVGSRLLRGHHDSHETLEAFAVAHFSAPAALYFSTGFQANYALLTTLPSRHDVIIYDEFVHASMRDGIVAGQAKSVRVAHNDLAAFEDALKQAAQNRRADGTIWLLVESLYSMDGDFAPLDELFDLAQLYDAYFVIDEAHACGVYGAGGRGLAYELSQARGYERVITMHTCGKALGVAGALVCGSYDIIDYLINSARGFIYSTAPMPLQAHLVQKSLELCASDEGEQRRTMLQHVCAFVQGECGGVGSPIVPLMIGDDHRAVEVARALQDQGYDIRAIRPPTVPQGSARLRLSLNALLDEKNLFDFVKSYKLLSL